MGHQLRGLRNVNVGRSTLLGQRGRGGRRRSAVWTLEQLQSGAPTYRRKVGPQEDEQESTERTPA